jgi:hypothetical protein
MLLIFKDGTKKRVTVGTPIPLIGASLVEVVWDEKDQFPSGTKSPIELKRFNTYMAVEIFPRFEPGRSFSFSAKTK